jgi:hypothetical protein
MKELQEWKMQRTRQNAIRDTEGRQSKHTKKTQRRKLKEKQLVTRTPPNNEHMVDRMGQNYVTTD